MSYIVYFTATDKKVRSIKFSKEVEAAKAVEVLQQQFPQQRHFFIKKLNLIRKPQK